MKILVSGQSGFIGGYVTEVLLDAGNEVLGFDRVVPQNPNPDISYIFGDIRDATQVTEAMAHVDGYIHLAGVLGTSETILNPRPAAETNVLGGLNVLEAASQYNIPGVVICVGNHFMDNTYAITKTTVERFCNMYRQERGLQVSKVRALNAYGPKQVPVAPFGPSKVRKIMPSFVCRALTGEPIQIYGDGSQIMDMVYVVDVALTLIATLNYTMENGAIENTLECGTGKPTTVLEIAQVVQKYVPGSSIEHLPMRAGEPEKSVVLANPETMKVLDPEWGTWFRSLNGGVRDTVEYYKEYLGLI